MDFFCDSSITHHDFVSSAIKTITFEPIWKHTPQLTKLLKLLRPINPNNIYERETQKIKVFAKIKSEDIFVQMKMIV